MRLKYYLKGLGIGMIIAALLMGIAGREPSAMTDEEIKIRAKELGMVEQKTLADAIKPTEGPTETKPPVTPAPQEETKPVDTNAPIEEIPTEEPASTDEPSVSSEVIEFEIFKGESSDSISNRLEEQGLIENGGVYNSYLCSNGYDRKLHFGTYQLKIGMSEEEITKIITRTR